MAGDLLQKWMEAGGNSSAMVIARIRKKRKMISGLRFSINRQPL